MIKRGDKKGSHVEIIISFIIFISFIFFIFSIIGPSVTTQKDKEGIIDNIEFNIIENISSDVKIITLNISTTTQDCIELDEEIINLEIGPNIVSKGKMGDSLNCYISSADPNNLKIERKSISDNFSKIYYSDAFPSITTSSLSCQLLVRGIDYELGLTKTDKYLFENKMVDLIGQYNDYDEIKTNFKIPKGVNFGYGIELSNGTTFETEVKNISTNIYIRRTPIKYMNSEGNISMGFLKIKVW
jgi:hypothetical protein